MRIQPWKKTGQGGKGVEGVKLVNLDSEIEKRIRDALPGGDVDVVVEGNRALVRVTSDSFETLSRVRRHQAVYACIQGLIADGSLHAVSIDAATAAERA